MNNFSKPASFSLKLRVFCALIALFLAACVSVPHTDIQPVSSPMSDDSYLGLPKETALAQARAAGLRARVIKEEGQSYRVTKDHRPNRLNFVVEEGKVVRIHKG